MTAKRPCEYTQQEVNVWLNAIGLGSRIPDFEENAIDGAMLTTLSTEELEGDLGLSTLQIRKFEHSLEFANSLAGGVGSGADQSRLMALEAENANLKEEIASLNEVVKLLQQQNAAASQPYSPAPAPAAYYAPAPAPAAYYAPAPAPAAYYAPAPAPAYQQPSVGAPVVKGAAVGATKGAIIGAIGGAIAGDPAQGAKMGAAMGGAAGGMQGFGERRRHRMRY